MPDTPSPSGPSTPGPSQSGATLSDASPFSPSTSGPSTSGPTSSGSAGSDRGRGAASGPPPAGSGPGGSRWADLGPRVISAVVLLALTFGALYAPNPVWAIYLRVVLVIAFWELAALAEPGISIPRRVAVAALPVVTFLVTWAVPGSHGALSRITGGEGWIVLVAAPAALGLALVRGGRAIFFGYALLLGIGTLGIGLAYALHGPVGVIGLVLLVAVSDTAAYFAGRSLGGPKFWPRVSPKKTWSGTVAGWVAAAVFAVFAYPAMMGTPLFAAGVRGGAVGWALALGLLGAGLALAGQMGDIAESAIKRRAGVKDASRLIPGHGGVLDRIDALVAAAAVVYLVNRIAG